MIDTFDSRVVKLGELRQNAHPNGTKRYYDNPNTEDIIGIAGELAFAERYGLIPDTTIRPNGDGHVDFSINYNGRVITFDVKTAIKAYNLLIKEWEIGICADVLILAEYKNKNVKFLGWASKKEMSVCKKKVFSSLGILNYYKHSSTLNSMDRLDFFFKNNKLKQIT